MTNVKIVEIGKRLEKKGIPTSLLNSRQINDDSDINQVVQEIEEEFNQISSSKHRNEVENLTTFKNDLNQWSKEK
ncbi:hypothetical protein GM418_10910 [Maribellus comscasis]|uniref:Uncharacterized protein n=1 Tax=Maribellus comscasis TaxID=2681766 RepID=A0A6I6JSS4_9BACT|nr:hypothetical protein [Maribellus comscasis]QGY44150.1 hypothetical protein GM418_10910 [Maribellus comscasis]